MIGSAPGVRALGRQLRATGARAARVLSWDELDADPRAFVVLCALCLYFVPVLIEMSQTTIGGLSTDAIRNLNDFPLPGLPAWASTHRLRPRAVRWLLDFLILCVPVALYWGLRGRRHLAAGVVLGVALIRVYLFGLSFFHATVNYYFHFFFLFIVLFLPSKVACLRWGLALTYFFSGLAKLSDSWLSGEYFKSVPGGLPGLPDDPYVITCACHAVILLELVGPFLLLRRVGSTAQRLAMAAFLAFHAYSALLIHYIYPLLMVLLLLTVFVDLPEHSEAGFDQPRHRWIFGCLMAGLACLTEAHLLIPGSYSLTQEGKMRSLFMFDANKGCRAELDLAWGDEVVRVEQLAGFRNGVRWQDGRIEPAYDRLEAQRTSPSGDVGPLLPSADGMLRRDGRVIYNPRIICEPQKRNCCDPYFFRAYIEQLRRREHPTRVGLRLWVALNGWPVWHELVDEYDFDPAQRPYALWSHNDWIRLPGDDAPSVYR